LKGQIKSLKQQNRKLEKENKTLKGPLPSRLLPLGSLGLSFFSFIFIGSVKGLEDENQELKQQISVLNAFREVLFFFCAWNFLCQSMIPLIIGTTSGRKECEQEEAQQGIYHLQFKIFLSSLLILFVLSLGSHHERALDLPQFFQRFGGGRRGGL